MSENEIQHPTATTDDTYEKVAPEVDKNYR
jgi:hypothetical protein